MGSTVSEDQIRQIVFAYYHDPFQVLGAHLVDVDGETRVAIRAFRPEAREVFVIDEANKTHPMTRLHEHGFFEAVVARPEVFKYRLAIQDRYGNKTTLFDPYAFLPVLTDFDLQLLGEGNHHRSYEKLGAHLMTVDGVAGVHLPCGRPTPNGSAWSATLTAGMAGGTRMRVWGGSGIWELFIPGLGEGTCTSLRSRGHLTRSMKKPTRTPTPPNCAPARPRSCGTSTSTAGATRRGWSRRSQTNFIARADVDLRGAPGLVDARAGGGTAF